MSIFRVFGFADKEKQRKTSGIHTGVQERAVATVTVVAAAVTRAYTRIDHRDRRTVGTAPSRLPLEAYFAHTGGSTTSFSSSSLLRETASRALL